jgi:hypothetical protein
MNLTLYNGFLGLLKDGGWDSCESSKHEVNGIRVHSCTFQNFEGRAHTEDIVLYYRIRQKKMDLRAIDF